MEIISYSNKLTERDVARIPFFYDVREDDLEKLAEILNLRKFNANQYIFKEGDIQTGMYFIMDGTVKVLKKNDKGNEVLLAELQAPQIFGEMALIDRGRRSASVITLNDLIVAELTWDNFENLLVTKPKIAVHIIRKIALTLSLRLRNVSISLAHITQ
ncbi:MAG: cyclic nucleotide-binding domain-containing protein [bacterium]